jgi:hypothetical protein
LKLHVLLAFGTPNKICRSVLDPSHMMNMNISTLTNEMVDLIDETICAVQFVQSQIHLPLTIHCQTYIKTSKTPTDTNLEDGNYQVCINIKTLQNSMQCIPKAEVTDSPA